MLINCSGNLNGELNDTLILALSIQSGRANRGRVTTALSRQGYADMVVELSVSIPVRPQNSWRTDSLFT